MHFLVATLVLAAVAVVTATGHSHHVHHYDHHGQGTAVSYAMVTKHEDHKSRGQPYHIAHHGHVKQYEDHVGHGQHHDHHGHAKYDFTYGVKDPKTGDVKSHWESRNGDSVKGGYALKEADGTTRVVKYSADKKKGFEASVHKVGKAHHNGQQEHHHSQQEHHNHASGFAVHHDQFTAHHRPGHHAYAGHHGHQEHKGHATSYIVVKQEVKH